MKLQEFRQRVHAEFGKNLEHATPANVREFLDKLQQQSYRKEQAGKPLEINEPAASYEEIIRDFFARVLENPTEDAFINLWVMAFELSFAAEEEQYSDMLSGLFKETED